jgi:hypothetical protein
LKALFTFNTNFSTSLGFIPLSKGHPSPKIHVGLSANKVPCEQLMIDHHFPKIAEFEVNSIFRQAQKHHMVDQLYPHYPHAPFFSQQIPMFNGLNHKIISKKNRIILSSGHQT